MLVQCPSCHTTYRVSENLVSKSKPTFRCSRCTNIFVLGSKPAAHSRDEPPAPAPRLQDVSSELSISFPPPEPSATARENVVESPTPPAATNGPAASPGEKESLFDIREREQEWSLAPHSDHSEASFSLRDEKSFAEIHNPIEQSFDFASERSGLPCAVSQTLPPCWFRHSKGSVSGRVRRPRHRSWAMASVRSATAATWVQRPLKALYAWLSRPIQTS